MSLSPRKRPTTGLTDRREPIRPIYAEPRRILTWVVTVAWMGNITLLSTGNYSASFSGSLLTEILRTFHLHLAPHTFNVIHMFIRKAAHCTEYGIFSLLLFHSFTPRRQDCWNTRAALAAFVVAGLFSLLDEYHQSFVPSRTASLRDCAIDTSAAFAALLLLYAGRRLEAAYRRNTPMGQSVAG